MNKLILASAIAAVSLSHAALAAEAKSYQVTGPVLDVTDTLVTVQKGKEKWEINKGSAALPEGLKKGDKVTIEYTMTATKVTSKSAKKDAAKETKTTTTTKETKTETAPAAAH